MFTKKYSSNMLKATGVILLFVLTSIAQAQSFGVIRHNEQINKQTSENERVTQKG